MIKFSEKKQTHYDVSLNYPDLPDDLVDVNDEQHQENLKALNSGYHVFSDFSLSEQRPSSFHKWLDGAWVDNRTDTEITEYNRSILPKISKRQFSLYLFDNNKYDEVMTAINANPRFKIEFDTVADIERLSPTVSAMTALLGWTDQQVDTMWTEALEL